jgi:hypothetical protein
MTILTTRHNPKSLRFRGETLPSKFSFTVMSNFPNFVCYWDTSSLYHQNRKEMDEFMLIFRHQDGKEVASPEQIQEWMKQTMEWIDGIASQNKFVLGNGLPFEDARVVHHDKMVTNGPFGDIKETIAGYIVVRAESVDEAVEFAKGSPILQGEGNTVEVRRVARGDGVHGE